MTTEEQTICRYGTSWCRTTRSARRFLDQHGIAYRWIDIDEDPVASAYVIEVNGGNRSVPTIVFLDGTILVEPSSAELTEKLGL